MPNPPLPGHPITESPVSNLEDTLRKVLAATPDNTEALLQLAELYENSNRSDDALAYFQRVIEIDPTEPDVYLKASSILQKLGRYDEALKTTQKALALEPSSPSIRVHLGLLLHQQNRNKDAIFQLEIAFAENPTYLEALIEKGIIQLKTNLVEDSVATFDQGLAVDNQNPKLHAYKGIALTRLGQFDSALVSYRHSLSLDPQDPAVHSNLGILLRQMGQDIDSVNHLRTAVQLEPDFAEAHQSLAFGLLNAGEIEQGLNEFEWRWQVPGLDIHLRTYTPPLWNGTDDLSEKTLLLWTEQGPQDVTIWASSLPEIINRTKHCIVNTYPKLVSLYQRSFPEAEVRPDSPNYDPDQNDFDTHLPMGSLFRHMRPDLKPATQDAYLIPDPNRVAYWRQQLAEIGPPPYVGISWKGAMITDLRSQNYTEVSDWAELIQMKATFVTLQCGESASELGQFEHLHGVAVHEFENLDLFDDLDEVAGFSAALDIAISVSTCVSALTAGVGTKTWILAWKQSPWNNVLLRSRGPDVTHFERNTGETWEPCFSQIRQHLQSIIDD